MVTTTDNKRTSLQETISVLLLKLLYLSRYPSLLIDDVSRV